MATVTARPRSTITQQMANIPAGGQAHERVTDGTVDAPVTATLVSAALVSGANKTNEYGDFDFSAIPDGSTINSITVRQRVRNRFDDVTGDIPSSRFALKVSGVERVVATYEVDTGGGDATQAAAFAAPPITTAELKTPLAFSLAKKTTLDAGDPAIPSG